MGMNVETRADCDSDHEAAARRMVEAVGYYEGHENLIAAIAAYAASVAHATPQPTAAPERQWKCACGWKGVPSQMTVNNDLRVCPECGASGGLILDETPTPADEEVARAIAEDAATKIFDYGESVNWGSGRAMFEQAQIVDIITAALAARPQGTCTWRYDVSNYDDPIWISGCGRRFSDIGPPEGTQFCLFCGQKLVEGEREVNERSS